MKCKGCDREFHHCTSCDSERCVRRGFCSDKCWHASQGYRDNIKQIEEFIESLNIDQIRKLDKVLIDYDDHWIFIDDLIGDRKKENK